MKIQLYLIITSLFFLNISCNKSDENPDIRLATFPSHGKNCGFYIAQKRGYYANLDVKILPVYQNVLSYLASGEANIAQILCSDAINAINRGVEIKIIAIRDAKFPIGTISLLGSGIRTPNDYSGKKWGHSVDFSPEKTLLPTLGKLNGFDPSSIKINHVAYPARLNALLKKEVDFISAWWGSGYPAQLIQVNKKNIDVNYIKWSDHGINIYGECLVVANSFLEKNEKHIRSFLQGAIRGFKDGIKNTELAVNVAFDQINDKTLSKDVIRLQWEQSKELLFDEINEEKGLFWIDQDKLEQTIKMSLTKKPRDSISEFYFNLNTRNNVETKI